MPKYVIEREIPGAGSLSAEELNGISQKSCSVLNNLGPRIQWVTKFTVYTLHLTRNWLGSMPARADFQQTESQK